MYGFLEYLGTLHVPIDEQAFDVSFNYIWVVLCDLLYCCD